MTHDTQPSFLLVTVQTWARTFATTSTIVTDTFPAVFANVIETAQASSDVLHRLGNVESSVAALGSPSSRFQQLAAASDDCIDRLTRLGLGPSVQSPVEATLAVVAGATHAFQSALGMAVTPVTFIHFAPNAGYYNFNKLPYPDVLGFLCR